MQISKTGASARIFTLFVLLALLTPHPTQTVTVKVDHDIRVHVDNDALDTIAQGLWHVGQLTGAGAFAYLLYQHRNANIPFKPLLYLCAAPAIYTLIDSGISGLHDLWTPKQTAPESLKQKIKKFVKEW
jgi:hypothetical protein